MIVKCRFGMDCGFVGTRRQEIAEVEVPDDASEEERDRLLMEELSAWAHEHVEYWYDIVE